MAGLDRGCPSGWYTGSVPQGSSPGISAGTGKWGACERRASSPSAQHLPLGSSPATSVNRAVLETYSRDEKTEAETQKPQQLSSAQNQTLRKP